MKFKTGVVVLVLLIVAGAFFWAASSIEEWTIRRITSSFPEGVTAGSIKAAISGRIVAREVKARGAIGKEFLRFSADEVRIQVSPFALIKQLILSQLKKKASPSRTQATFDPQETTGAGFRKNYDSFAEIYKDAMDSPWRKVEVLGGRLTVGPPEAEALLASPIAFTADRRTGGLAHTEVSIDRVAFGAGSSYPPFEKLTAKAKLYENCIVLDELSLLSGPSRLRVSGQMSDIKNLIGQLSLDSFMDTGLLKTVLGREQFLFSNLATFAKLEVQHGNWRIAAKMTFQPLRQNLFRELEVVADGQLSDRISTRNVTVKTGFLEAIFQGDLLDERELKVSARLKTLSLAALNPKAKTSLAQAPWSLVGYLSGSREQPLFHGDFLSQPGPAAAGESAKGVIDYRNGRLTFRNLNIQTASGRLEGEATIDLSKDKSVESRLAVTDLTLDDLCRQLGIAVPVKGTAGGTIEISGTLIRPFVNGGIRSENITVADTAIGPAEISFTHNSVGMDISGSALNRLVILTAQTSQESMRRLSGTLIFKEINSTELSRILGKDIAYGASFSCAGGSKFNFDAADPRTTRFDATLSKLRVERNGTQFVNNGPVVFRYAESLCEIEKMSLRVSPEGEIGVTGTVRIVPKGNPRLDLHLRVAAIPFPVAAKYYEPLKAVQGSANAEIDVGGDAVRPTLTGRLSTSDSTVKLPFIESPVKVQDAIVEFHEGWIEGKPVKLRVGEGSASGSFSYRDNKLELEAVVENLKGTALSKLLPGTPLTKPDSMITGTISLSGDFRTREAATGTIKLEKIEATVEDHTFQLAARNSVSLSRGALEFQDLSFTDMFAGGIFSASGKIELSGNRNLDIHLLASGADVSLFKSSLPQAGAFSGKADLDLTIRGPADHPQITGIVQR